MALSFVRGQLSDFGKSIDLTRKDSNIRKVALAPAAVPFALGAGVNQLSGGKTTTYNVWKAASGKAPAPTYSTFTQAASGYQSATPGAGTWRAPLANPTAAVFAGEVVSSTVKNVAAPTANALAEGLFGVKLTTLAWGVALAGAGVLVGPPLIKRALA